MIDFDTPISRANTDSIKYDFAIEFGKKEDVIPLWVADMDFKTSERILEEIQKRVAHGIFGYTETKNSYFEAVANWMKEKHHWEVQPEWLVKTPSVVFALAMAVKAFTKQGDAVIIQQPVYYPFALVVENNKRKLVVNEVILGEDNKYHIDFEDFERKIVTENVKLFLLCNPHNPVCRVWTKEELLKLGDICLKHNVLVISDEIHQDFVFGDREHIVFANLKEEYKDITVTCTSPSKTFNLAGLQASNIFISNVELRDKFKAEITACGYSGLNAIALVACEAAYRYGDEWYEVMKNYIEGNIQFMKDYIEREIPQLTMIEPEGTYLMWVDFRKLGLSEEALNDLITNKANLWLNEGTKFGKSGAGFERFNIACPRVTLEKALERLKNAINSL